MDIPQLPRKIDKKEKEKKGGAAWAPGAGLELAGQSSAPLASIGVSPASQLAALANLLAKVTGLSAVAATKFGLLALLLAGGTLAAAISLLLGSDSSSSKPSFGSTVFDRNAPPPGSRDGSLSASDAPAAPAPSGLDVFSSANPVSAELADGGETAPPQAAQTAAPGGALKIPDSAPKHEAAAPNKPKMKASKGLPGGAAAGGQVALKAVPSLSGKVGGNFQDIYKRGPSGAFGAARTAPPPARSMTAVLQKSGALDQARAVSRVSQKAARMGAADGASSTASTAFDASTARASNLGSTLSGPNGKLSSADSISDVSNIGLTEPPSPADNSSNQTPYQNLIFAGMAALMLGQMLVQAAGMMVSAAQKNPVTAPQMLAAAKAIAVAAMGAGGGAAGAGSMLASQYQQTSQAVPFVVGGAVIIAQAAIVLVMAEMAGQQAAAGVDGAAAQGQSEMPPQMQPPQMPSGGNDSSQSDAQKKAQEAQAAAKAKADAAKNRTITGPQDNSYKGSIPDN